MLMPSGNTEGKNNTITNTYININTNENTKVRELSGEMQPSGNTGEKEAGTGEIQR